MCLVRRKGFFKTSVSHKSYFVGKNVKRKKIKKIKDILPKKNRVGIPDHLSVKNYCLHIEAHR